MSIFSSASFQRSLRFALPLVWGVGIVASLWSLERYKSLAGRADSVQGVPPLVDHGAPARPRLVMYVHPHCPCTRASLAEFRQLVDIARSRGRQLSAEIVVVVAKEMDPSWRDGAITRAAEQLAAAKDSGVSIRYDLDAVEAHDVRIQTSGHTVLLDADGKQLFAGGLTRSRGHAGDNAGSRAVADLLNDRKPEAAATSVFGCPLDTGEACRTAEACRPATTSHSDSQVRIAPHPASHD